LVDPCFCTLQEYLYLEFPSETTTRSGYNIKRKNFVVAALKRDKLYVLSSRWVLQPLMVSGLGAGVGLCALREWPGDPAQARD
jgi:hypothetical protein